MAGTQEISLPPALLLGGAFQDIEWVGELLMRPSKCARITFFARGISPGKQVIIESTLRTI